MQNNEQSLLLTHRENYIVPKGQEQTVHCKIAKLDSNGNFLESVRLVRFGLKKFETTIKDNLETMGYTVEILHHPMGKYSNSVIKSKDAEIEALKAELEAKDNSKEMAAKDAEIAALRKALAEAKKGAETKDEAKGDAKPAEGAEEKKNKGGRPRKEE